MSKIFKFVLIFIFFFLLICLLTPFVGGFYELMVGYKLSSGFWGSGHPEYFEGFFISYSFFTTLAITIFGSSKKYFVLAAFLLPILLIQISVPESLIISVCAAIVAWLIAQVVLIINKKIKKK
jgi:hypothetical protein